MITGNSNKAERRTDVAMTSKMDCSDRHRQTKVHYPPGTPLLHSAWTAVRHLQAVMLTKPVVSRPKPSPCDCKSKTNHRQLTVTSYVHKEQKTGKKTGIKKLHPLAF